AAPACARHPATPAAGMGAKVNKTGAAHPSPAHAPMRGIVTKLIEPLYGGARQRPRRESQCGSRVCRDRRRGLAAMLGVRAVEGGRDQRPRSNEQVLECEQEDVVIF